MSWNVDPKHGLDCGSYYVTMGCPHRRNGGACGGCFARLYRALLAISEGADGKKTADEVFDSARRQNSEKKSKRARSDETAGRRG